MLVPLYFMISLWGKSNRQAAALKFLIYMVAGSCLMVAAVLVLYFSGSPRTFDLTLLAHSASSAPHAAIACAIFLLAFAVKTPLFPFHAWLPDAYYQASVPGTILLSAILSKAGVYGILRIGFELFPQYMVAWGPLLLGFAVAGVLYAALAAWRQDDYKKLIAYSSLSHVNFVLAGLFVWNQISHEGAIVQAVNHGITIAALFLSAGWLEERLSSTTLGGHSGLAKYMPMLCWVTFLFVLSAVALPSTNNFVGELLILFGVFSFKPWVAFVLGLSVILSVVYMLRLMQKLYFEKPSPQEPQWVDLRAGEWLAALPLIFLIMWIGVYPTPLLDQAIPAAEKTAQDPHTKEL
jgi:NADH-quinone oxidoreductase subunit M